MAKNKPKGLTAKQMRFVDEYLVDLNAKQAAIRAGYSEKSAEVEGSRLLSNAKVSARVERAIAERSERTKVTADGVLEELYILIKSDIDHYRVSASGELELLEGAHIGAKRAVSSIKRSMRHDREGNVSVEETQIRLWDKPAAIRLAMQHLGMLTEKHEHRHDIKGEVKVQGDINERLAKYEDLLSEFAKGSLSGSTEDHDPREPVDPERAD